MGMIQKVQTLKGAVKSIFTTTTMVVSGWFQGLIAQWTQVSYESLARKAYRNPYVQRAIEIVAQNFASVTLEVQFVDSKGDLKTDPNHPVLQVLQRPNPKEGRILFFTRMVNHLYLAGEIFIRLSGPLTGPNAGKPRVMKLLRPDRLERIVKDDATEDVVSYEFRTALGAHVTYPAAEVIHIKTFNPMDDDRGYPLLTAALMSVDIMEEGLSWNKAVFQNKGRLPGFFKYTGPGELTDGQFKKLKSEMQEGYAKDSAAARPGLLEKDFDWQSVSVNQKDADWLEGDKQAMRRICVAIGVDPSLLGDSSNKTYSNMESALKALMLLKVLPMLAFVLDELNVHLMPRYGNGKYLIYNKDGIEALQEDQNAKYERLGKAVKDSILTPNEARSEIDWTDAGPEGDALLAPFNVVPLSTIVLGPDEEETPAATQARTLRSMTPEEFDVLVDDMLRKFEETSATPSGDGGA